MQQKVAYVPHHLINKPCWDALIEQSQYGLVYAQTAFLDAMSPGWDALILGDYEAVMPLTWRKRAGIKYLYQPPFCQQLGIFSIKPVPDEVVNDFLRKIAIEFRLIEIYLNENNHPDQPTSIHQNFVLSINKPYTEIRKSYKSDLLKNLNRAEKFSMKYLACNDVENAIEQYKMLYGGRMHLRAEDYEALIQLCLKWLPLENCIIREVRLQNDKKDELLAIGLFLKDQRRLYNIASTTLANGRTLEANHFLFDQLIREFSGKNLLLDFEGSDLPGVAKFYLKFGPENRPYFFWKSNRLPAILRWWKK